MADAGVGGGAAGGKVGVGVGVGTEVAIMVGDSDVEGAMVGGHRQSGLVGAEELAPDGNGVGASYGEEELCLTFAEVGSVPA